MRKQLLAILLPLFLPMATVNGAATSDLQSANKAFLDADRDFCHKYFDHLADACLVNAYHAVINTPRE
ncbi:MAG: hypothetical protein E7082_08715 [Bacteroidales bacterium]|nr:hypothetical protein [Bacteroidales bacterium]